MEGEHREARQRGHTARVELQRAGKGGARRVQAAQPEGRSGDAQPHLRRRARVLPQRLAEPAMSLWVYGNGGWKCYYMAVKPLSASSREKLLRFNGLRPP